MLNINVCNVGTLAGDPLCCIDTPISAGIGVNPCVVLPDSVRVIFVLPIRVYV